MKTTSTMDTIYHYTGMITFWLIAGSASILILWLLSGLFYQKIWLPYRFHLWAVQMFEYRAFMRNARAQKAANYEDTDWAVVLNHLATIEGRVQGREWRGRHLFRKQIVRTLEEMLQSPAAPLWAKNKAKIKSNA